MKTKCIYVIAIILFCFSSCYAQHEKSKDRKDFLSFLNKFQTVNPPFNYKQLKGKREKLTKEQAMQYLQKKDTDLYCMVMEFGLETEDVSYSKEENIPSFDFKYILNDSIYMLCTREAILGNEIDTIMSCLYSFDINGKIIDKNIIAGWHSESNLVITCISCIFLDKNLFRVYFYEINDDTKKEKEFFSTVYFIEYQITENGSFQKMKVGIGA